MDASTIALITALINLAIKYAPEMIESGKLAISLLTRDTELSEEEKKKILDASLAAHAALQKRCEERINEAETLGVDQ